MEITTNRGCFEQQFRATASDSYYLTSVFLGPLEASCSCFRCTMKQVAAASNATWSKLQLLQMQHEESRSCFRCNLRQVAAASDATWSKLQLLQMQPEASCSCFRCNPKQVAAASDGTWSKLQPLQMRLEASCSCFRCDLKHAAAHHSVGKYLSITTNYYFRTMYSLQVTGMNSPLGLWPRRTYDCSVVFIHCMSSQQLPSHTPTATIL